MLLFSKFSSKKLYLFSKTEIYNELSGSGTEQIEIIVRPEYYEREFDIKDDKKN